MEFLPNIQIIQRPGIIDFGWGHPDPVLLPAEGLSRAAALTLARDWREALTYGFDQGPGQMIELVRGRLGRIEGAAPSTAELMITGGTSQALDMVCGQIGQPGDVVIAEAPTYHLALRIFRDRGLRVVTVPGDGHGLRVDEVAATLRRLRAAGERVAFLYCVASFGNPSGAVLAPDRRRALADLALGEGLTVIEDDAYGELWYDAPPPPSIYSLAPGGPVVRLGSYAKVLSPGLRVGWMLASPGLVRRCAGSGMLDSGGGVSHFAAHVVSTFIELGLLDPHIARLRASLRARRDAMLAALAEHMPAGCAWNAAAGGFFIWVSLPEALDGAALLPAAEAAGASYLPGERFFAEGGGRHNLRLCFSLLPPARIAEGIHRLGQAMG